MPTYEIRDIPDPLWKALTERATHDGYPLHVLVLQLLEDYAAGEITPGGAPPPLLAYAFLKEPFRRLLIASPDMIAWPVRERWARLRSSVEQQPASCQLMDAVPSTNRAAILTWLERQTVKQVEG
jgi:hypothetical protein